jgi:hypothetical protein
MDTHFFLSLFHLLFVAPLFLGIGFVRAGIPDWLYMVILVIGFVILVYHGYKLFMRYRSGSSYAWVNAIHVLFVAPLLIYIGNNKKNTPRGAYEMLVLMGFAVLGYHLYSLAKMLQVKEV